jgi:hypothetical protein
MGSESKSGRIGVVLVLVLAWWGATVEAAVLSLPPESFPQIATSGDLGQTITTPSGAERVLDSYTMYGFGSGGDAAFRSSVYKYNPLTNQVVPGALYTSGLRTALRLAFQGFTFDTGGLLLEPGAQYLLVLQDKGIGNIGGLQIAFSTVGYSGGEYRLNDDPARYLGTGPNWVNYISGKDLALTANFSAAAPAGAPLPPGLGVGAILSCGVVVRRMRLRRVVS